MIPLLLLALGVPADAGDPLPPHAVARLGTLRFRSGDRVRGAAVSPDGTRVAVPAHGYVVVWDAATGREVCRGGPVRGAVIDAAFSPDGRTVAAATWYPQDDKDWPVVLFDAATGRESGRVAGHRGGSEWVAFADGRTLVSGGKDGHLRVWDLRTAAEVRRFARPGRYYPKPEAVSPDGKYLACMERGDAQRGPLHVYEIATGRECFKVIVPSSVWSLAFAPDGHSLACRDTTVYRYELPSGRETGRWQLPKDQFGGILACANDGPYVLTASDTGLTAYDVSSGKPAAFPLRLPVCVAGRGRTPTDQFVTGRGSRVEVWDLRTGRPRHPTGGHTEAITAVVLTADGRAVTADTQHVRRWDKNGREERVWPCRTHYAASGGVLAPGGGTFANVNGYHNILLWDTATGRQTGSVKFSRDSVGPPLFSPDGRAFACICGRSLQVRETADSRLRWEVPREGRSYTATAFTPDGGTLFSGDEGGAIREWDAATGKRLRQLEGHPEFMERPAAGGFRRIEPRPGHSGGVVCLAVSPDGRRLVSAGRDRTLRVWELATGKECGLLERATGAVADVYGLPAFSLAFSPDGSLLAAPGQEGDRRQRIDLWDVRGGRRRATLDGHRDPVSALAFAPDGRRLISGGADTVALVWDVPPRPHAPAAALGETRAAALWADLGDADPAKAYRALGAWLADPEATVAAFRRLRRPAPKPDAARVRRLIDDLDADEFEVRERASKELKAMRPAAGNLLRRALAERPPVEVARRIEAVLAASADDDLRDARAVEVLEALGTPAARALLEEWARSDPAGDLPREAAAALARLRRR